MKPSFAFFGTHRFSKIVLQILLDNKLKPSLVITSPDKPVGRKLVLTPSPVKQFAIENNLQVATPKTKEELTTAIQQFSNLPRDLRSSRAKAVSLEREASMVRGGTMELKFGILAAYGLILPPVAIKTLPNGILNIHPSLLPKYRGSSPIQSAILNGDEETGVTIMKLTERVDEGEIVAQEKVPISPDDTTVTLGEKLFALGTNLLIKILPKYLSGEIKLIPQNQSKYHVLKHDTITKKFTKQDGFIPLEDLKCAVDPRCHSRENGNLASLIDRRFRAFTPWPGIWTTLSSGKRMIITKCHLENGVLKIDLVKIEGKGEEKFVKF